MSARSEALNILYRIMHDDGYASLIMRESKIKKEEMASVTNIVYGVLRNYTYLEYQWRKYAKRTKLKTALAIDIAVFEMFFTNEKEYAILNEVHNLVNTHDQSFVNAILRKSAGEWFTDNGSKGNSLFTSKMDHRYVECTLW